MWRETVGKWRKKQEIEPGEAKTKLLYSYEMNCISSTLGESEFRAFHGRGAK
jgi:hypothetical protein